MRTARANFTARVALNLFEVPYDTHWTFGIMLLKFCFGH